MTGVIDFTTRKKIAAEVAEKEMQAELAAQEAEQLKTQEELDEKILEDRKICIELLDQAKVLVEAGRLVGLTLVGMDPTTNLFISEMRISQVTVGRGHLFGYIGVLESAKLELVDLAYMAPMMAPDGTVSDPFREQVLDDDDDDFDEQDFE